MAILFSLPGWVDASKPAGRTPQLPSVLRMARTYWRDVFTLQKFCASPPHICFLLVAAVLHVVDRYDFEAARQGLAAEWLAHRALVNVALVGSWYAFFLLVAPRICARKFNPSTSATGGQLCHDVWYWTLGVLQVTFWECMFVRAWATGRVAYTADEELTSMKGGFSQWLFAVAVTAFWLMFTQAFRAPHFYFCHRLIHFRPLYRAFHALHHRNVDVEPFSGLAMHPAEHLYYFTSAFLPAGVACLAPSALAPLLTVSPLVARYAFYMPTLSPGATHSGYEDHHLSQQEHYIHHTTFNKNFGAGPGCYLDHLFGTFADRVVAGEVADDAASPKAGAAKAAAKSPSSRATLFGMPSSFDMMFFAACLAVACLLGRSAALGARPPAAERHLVAGVTTFGPLAAAVGLWAWKDKQSWRWPFQREPLRFMWVHVVAGVAVSVLPVYSTVLAVL